MLKVSLIHFYTFDKQHIFYVCLNKEAIEINLDKRKYKKL